MGVDNGFARTDDPGRLQAICDRLGPATIEAFVQRWLAILPVPLTDAIEPAGTGPEPARVVTQRGNCFTRITDPAGLARIADTLSQPATIGRLAQVCDRWICTACLSFGLDLDEQERTGFRYGHSVYQAECSRDLLFQVGAQMDQVFDPVFDRTRPHRRADPAHPVRRQATPGPRRR